jgi:hypothetical protein
MHMELPMRELAERIPVSVPQIVANNTPTPGGITHAEKLCEMPTPVQKITPPQPSLMESAKSLLGRGLANLGDAVAGEEPVVLPTGKDYHAGDRVKEETAYNKTEVMRNVIVSANDYRKEHPNFSKNLDAATKVLDAVGKTIDIGMMLNGTAVGATTGAEIGGEIGSIVPGAGTAIGAGIGGAIGAVAGYKVAEKGIELRNKVFGSMLEGGKESFVEAARNIGTTETEKAEFAETAAQFFDASALAASTASIVKSGTNTATNLKSKVSAKAAHPAAVREVELAGTGMKVKAPVQEHGKTTSVSRKVESHGSDWLSKQKLSSNELAIPNKISPAMRAKIESNCGVKMPDNLIGYTKHGVDRALSRDNVGVSTESILDAWNNPIKVKFKADNSGKSFKIYGEDSTIVVNPKGEVVSCWAKRKEGHRL